MTRSHRNSFLLYDCVSRLTGVILSVKAEHGESDQHVRMGPHTPDHQCCRHGLHFRRRKENLCVEKMVNACTFTPAVKVFIQDPQSNVYECIANHKGREKTMTPQST